MIKGKQPNSIEIFKIDITESKDKIFDDILSIDVECGAPVNRQVIMIQS